MRTNLITTSAAVLLLLATGVVHGLWTGRWTDTDPSAAAASTLERLPTTIGGWTSTEMKKSEEELEVAEVSGYVMRRYVHQETGAAVTVIVLCGRPGPVAVHPPTACYRGVGYVPVSEPARYVVDSPDGMSDTFFMADFQKNSTLQPDPIRVFWGWSLDGHWSVPDNPRFAFGGAPALFKLYATEDGTPRAGTDENSSAVQFLTQLLPELRRSVFQREGTFPELTGNDNPWPRRRRM